MEKAAAEGPREVLCLWSGKMTCANSHRTKGNIAVIRLKWNCSTVFPLRCCKSGTIRWWVVAMMMMMVVVVVVVVVVSVCVCARALARKGSLKVDLGRKGLLSGTWFDSCLWIFA